MKKYRIVEVFKENRKQYKVQERFLFIFWLDINDSALYLNEWDPFGETYYSDSEEKIKRLLKEYKLFKKSKDKIVWSE